jgi:arylsulfatase A-like enzyme
VARHVRPAYLGLIAQLDAHLGRVLDALAAMGRLSDTLIVFASDHGEFAGDRGLGEKELFYDEIVRVPFIVCDPDPRADATRGSAIRASSKADVDDDSRCAEIAGAPRTSKDAHPAVDARIRPRRGAVRFQRARLRFRRARAVLRRGVRECRGFMVRTDAWKYVHWEGFRPQLFDLDADPLELADRGSDARYGAERAQMRERLFDWMARQAPNDRQRRRRRKPRPSGARHPHRIW